MNKNKLLVAGASFISAIIVVAGLVHGHPVSVLDPRGSIGQQEKQLITFALALSVVVVVPVFIMLFWFAWRYREDNPKKAKYSPDWDHNIFIEGAWWLIPSILIFILSVVAWNSSHQLDPFRPISAQKPLEIQVIALDWKWLFIYPEQNIATVNYAEIPLNRPVTFNITADAPMNSFWIPQLGGQVYAMPGMATQLHLKATAPGEYRGSSANISGKGFSGMTFTAKAGSENDFGKWVRDAQHSKQKLTFLEYDRLAKPSQNNPVSYYGSAQTNLYQLVIMKYMEPIQGISSVSDSAGHLTATGVKR